MVTKVLNIAGYKFEPLDNIGFLQHRFQTECENLNLKGTILLSKHGINFTIAGTEENIEQYIQFMEDDERFLNIPIKRSYSEKQPFRRMKVKLKKEIISLGREDINPRELTGARIAPKDFQSMLDNGEDVIVLDTRNEYETRVGLFENAIDLKLDTFRDFPKAIESLPEEYKNKQIVMYCTGGIRCEKASAYLKHKGLKNVFQLEGGIIEYTRQVKENNLTNNFIGKNFVFDERRGERVSKEIVANCHQCGTPCDDHVNCANESCHLLFIQCHNCKVDMNNCCSNECMQIIELPVKEQKRLRKGKHNSNKIFKKGRSPKLKYKLS